MANEGRSVDNLKNQEGRSVDKRKGNDEGRRSTIGRSRMSQRSSLSDIRNNFMEEKVDKLTKLNEEKEIRNNMEIK